MTKTIALAISAALLSLPATAQPATSPGQPGGAVVQGQSNTTGNDSSVSVSHGATGAETKTNNSAAGGNASKPEQAVPNSSGGGGSR